MYSASNPKDNNDTSANVFVVQFNGFMSQVTLMLSTEPHIPASFNMDLAISKCVTASILSNFFCHYLRNRSTLDIGVWDCIGIL